MELIVLMLVAGVGGYLLANSRFSKTIDDTGEKVASTTRGAADRAENWVSGLFRRSKKPESEVIEGSATEAPASAEKQPSRRKEEA